MPAGRLHTVIVSVVVTKNEFYPVSNIYYDLRRKETACGTQEKSCRGACATAVFHCSSATSGAGGVLGGQGIRVRVEVSGSEAVQRDRCIMVDIDE